MEKIPDCGCDKPTYEPTVCKIAGKRRIGLWCRNCRKFLPMIDLKP